MEFVLQMMMSSYHDPTFDQAHRALFQVTHAAIIEWLRRGGNFTMPTHKQKTTIRRWMKEHLVSLLLGFFCAGVTVGAVVGWVLRTLWHG